MQTSKSVVGVLLNHDSLDGHGLNSFESNLCGKFPSGTHPNPRFKMSNRYQSHPQTWYRRVKTAACVLKIFRGKFGIHYSRFRKYSLAIALSSIQSIKIWSDLNRFLIHESILLVIKLILVNRRFTIHLKIGILNRFSIQNLPKSPKRHLRGVKSVWELALMLVLPVGI